MFPGCFGMIRGYHRSQRPGERRVHRFYCGPRRQHRECDQISRCGGGDVLRSPVEYGSHLDAGHLRERVNAQEPGDGETDEKTSGVRRQIQPLCGEQQRAEERSPRCTSSSDATTQGGLYCIPFALPTCAALEQGDRY